MKQIKVEIVVIGAGVAGFSACIAAEKKGKTVLLIESSESIGGNAIQSNVGTICGAYFRTDSDQTKQVNHPMISFVIDGLQLLPKKLNNGLIINPYNVDEFKQFMQKSLECERIELWKSAQIKTATAENEAVKTIEVAYNNEVIEVSANAFVDTSGNGILSQLLEAPMLTAESYQNASQVFEVSNIDSSNEFGLNMSISKAVRAAINTRQLSETFINCSIIPGSLENNSALVKFTIPVQITDETDLKELAMLGALGANNLFALLISEIESMKNASIERIFPQPGIRIQQRAKGLDTLTKDDVLGMKKYTDSIAQGTWPIEIWEKNGHVEMTYFDADEFYDIPKGCICSVRFSNVFMAGKNISATDDAIASARVIGTCLQTGYSAGLLAAHC